MDSSHRRHSVMLHFNGDAFRPHTNIEIPIHEVFEKMVDLMLPSRSLETLLIATWNLEVDTTAETTADVRHSKDYVLRWLSDGPRLTLPQQDPGQLRIRYYHWTLL